MPPPTANPEAIARAIVEKTPAAPPPPGSTAEKAARIREKAQLESPRSALESLNARKPIEQTRTTNALDSAIGTERKQDGTRKLNTEQQRRFDEAQKTINLTRDYLEKGYDRLNLAQRGDVRRLVEQAIKAWPEANAVLSGMTPTERQAAIENIILKNPEALARIRSVF